jgi:signal transduction histidine kinase
MGSSSICLLLVDDNPGDRELIRCYLSDEREPSYTFLEAGTAAEAIDQIKSHKVDCILLDNRLPDQEGVEILQDLNRANGSVPLPVVLVSGQGDEAVAVRAINQGAQDFVVKEALTPIGLKWAIHNALEKLTLQQSLEQKCREIEEQNKMLAEASKLKSEFLATMSHEIRTPMNGVVGMAALLQETPLTPEQCEYVEIINRSASSLLTIINGILDFSKIESGKMETEEVDFSFNGLILSSTAPVSSQIKQKGLILRTDIDKSIPERLNGDINKISQVLINLLSNASKFTDHGEISLQVQKLKEDADRMWIQFAVKDSGIGIRAQDRGRLFEAFAQGSNSAEKKHGGTGLGLAISKRIVQALGGTIDFESIEGQGTTFWFLLPLRVATSSSSETTIASLLPVEHAASNARILLADDDLVNQKVGERILKKLGYNPVIVGSGKEVLSELEKSSYSLILMDCRMPELDGYETTSVIRANSSLTVRNIPIIALTANAIVGDSERCLAAGMNDYLSKPISISKLYSKIQKWLPNQILSND